MLVALILRRYARRLATRVPSVGRLIQEPARTIEAAYFLRYCLLVCTDRLLLMVRRRVSDLWRRAAQDANHILIHWSELYRDLLASIATLADDASVAESDLRGKLRSLVASHQQRKPPSRAQLVREKLIDEIRPVRSLLSSLMMLPWQAASDHPVLKALHLLKQLYERAVQELPDNIPIYLGRAWRGPLVFAAKSAGVKPRHFRVFIR